MKRIVIGFFATLSFAGFAIGQHPSLSPSDTVIKFYQALKNRKYVEGFQLSVYRGAISGLSAAEIQDLEPDFAATFASIPDKIEVKGEQITGDKATVFLLFEGKQQPQPVDMLRVGGQWLVGDQESLALVQQQGRAFFFNTRMIVNESEVYQMMTRLHSAQMLYAQSKNEYATYEDLVRLDGLPKEVADKEFNGYRLAFTLSADKKSYFAQAVPLSYGKSGRLSFYVDPFGMRAADLQGKPATAQSPFYKPE